MKSVRLAILISMIAAADVAFAAVEANKSEEASSYFLCKNQKTVRTIRIEKDTDENKCVAFYTKAGIDREVGRAQNVSTCEKVVENIKGNLEAANWKCRELGAVRITSSSSDAE